MVKSTDVNLPSFEKCRAVAIDLDGTLLDSKANLSARSRTALEQCISDGLAVIIATSRPARIFNRIFPKDLAIGCSWAIMNGAIAKGNPPLSGYFKETIPEEITRSIIDLALKFNSSIRLTLELEGYEFGANWTADSATLWQRNSATPEMVLSVEEAIMRQPCKIALGGLGIDILKLSDKLTHSFGDTISIVPSLSGNPLLNITNPQGSKPSALRKLLTPVGIMLKDVIAFGDDLPDIEMLKTCGISVAVGNAFPEVKSICKYQTLTNDNDGVAIVLEKIIAAKTHQTERRV